MLVLGARIIVNEGVLWGESSSDSGGETVSVIRSRLLEYLDIVGLSLFLNLDIDSGAHGLPME